MAERQPNRVNLAYMQAEYEKFRAGVAARPESGKITIRAVARVVENVHLEGRVRNHRLECDEPPERGGGGHGPAPLDYFVMGAAFWLLTQVARFAPLYDVPIEDASVEVRCSFDVAEKLGLDGPGAAFEEVAFAVAVQSPASPEQVRRLIAHAERACHAEQSLRNAVPLRTSATLNG